MVSLLFYIINDFSFKTFLLYFIGIWFCIAIGFDGFWKWSVSYPQLKNSKLFNYFVKIGDKRICLHNKYSLHFFTIFSAVVCFVIANIYFVFAIKNYYCLDYSVNALFTAAISLGGAIRLRYHPMCKDNTGEETQGTVLCVDKGR